MPALHSLPPGVADRMLNLIQTTNRDGSIRARPVPPNLGDVPMPQLASAVASDIDPYKDYSGPDIPTCPHCNMPSPQCIEVIYGPQMTHHFKKAAIEMGVIYCFEDEEDDERRVLIRRNFRKLLTQLKFGTAVLNGTPLPTYPDDGTNPFLGDSQDIVDSPLPQCVMDGSCTKFDTWLEDQKCVHCWGYDISDDTEGDDVDYPIQVVNFYRDSVERNVGHNA